MVPGMVRDGSFPFPSSFVNQFSRRCVSTCCSNIIVTHLRLETLLLKAAPGCSLETSFTNNEDHRTTIAGKVLVISGSFSALT